MAGTVAPSSHVVWLKRALLLIVLGLVVQLFCLTHITPASFLLFAGFGVGPVFLGLSLFAVAAYRKRAAHLREEQGATQGGEGQGDG